MPYESSVSGPPLLFRSIGIFEEIERRKDQVKELVRKLTVSEIESEGAAERVAAPLLLDVPVLDEAAKYAETQEVDADVSEDPMRTILDRSRAFYVKATEVTVVIPFAGDPEAFDIRPASFNPKQLFGRVADHELRLVLTITNPGINVNFEVEHTISEVKQHLDWLRPSAEQIKQALLHTAQSLIVQRKQQAGTHADIVNRLGIPVRHVDQNAVSNPPHGPTASRLRPSAKAISSELQKWDVFISHASEDKEQIARPLANSLQAKGLRVWYDEFSLTVGDSLRESIDEGLARSRFGVVILSQRFFEKHWPEQELNSLVTREVGGSKVILPVWHAVGFEEVRQYSPLLADRLAVSTDGGLEEVVEKLLAAIK